MDKSILITTLFVDIGGVLLSDGWSHEFRKLAVSEFNLDLEEMELRHSMVFETFELGKLTMEEYLNLWYFISHGRYPEPISGIHVCPIRIRYPNDQFDRRLKAKYGLKILWSATKPENSMLIAFRNSN